MTGPTRQECRASALVYLSAAKVVIIAIASLAVDAGRVYVVKAEMQLAADGSGV